MKNRLNTERSFQVANVDETQNMGRCHITSLCDVMPMNLIRMPQYCSKNEQTSIL